jgi:hypothetical protein
VNADKNVTHSKPEQKTETEPQPTATLTSQIPAATTAYTVTSQQILLSTEVLVTYNSVNTPYHCQAILDRRSQSNFITENLVQLLGSHKSPINMSVSGITKPNCTISFNFHNSTLIRITT